MEGRITEEKVTKFLLTWLETNNWKIISYDFPQSGTGICIHPNLEFRTTKNKDSFIPDIIAYKNNTVIFFENKDRFFLEDFHKVDKLRTTSMYSDSILNLLKKINYKSIFYGIGMPFFQKNTIRSEEVKNKTDFIICTMQKGSIIVFYDPMKIF